MAFHNVRLPEDIERGALGGPQFDTTVLTLSSGYEKRNINWERTRGRWNIGYGVDSKTNLESVLAFFYARQGKAHTFRFKDWTDYKVGDDATDTPQEISLGNGTDVDFQIVRRYTSGSTNFDRDLTRIVDGTVRVFVSGVEQTETTDYTVDVDNGIISFLSPPTLGFSIGVICEFDVPVRFDQDTLDLRAFRDDIYSVPEINIIEIKEVLGQTSSGGTAIVIGEAYDLGILLPYSMIVGISASNSSIHATADGSKFYASVEGSSTISQYDLSTANDLSSATLTGTTNLSAHNSNIRGVYLSEDGIYFFTLDQASMKVNKYILSTPYLLSSQSYDSSFSLPGTYLSLHGMDFSPNGLKMYIATFNPSKQLHEFDLSPSYDITSASLNTTETFSELSDGLVAMAVSSDISRVIVADNTVDTLWQYDLSTAGLLSSKSFSQSFRPYSYFDQIRGLDFSSDGQYLWISGDLSGVSHVYNYKLFT
jgi:uncharacterized protein (TIGR02217 family)